MAASLEQSLASPRLRNLSGGRQRRALVLEQRELRSRGLAREEGLTSLREAAITKVTAGITTLKEINKVTFIE